MNTRTKIKKIVDHGDYAKLVWTANLNMYNTGNFQENIKSLGAEVGANGIAFTGAAGVIMGKQKFPLRLGAGLIDRQTGEVVYFADGAEDSVSSMVIGPDGGIYVGNSPLRRALGRAIFGNSKSPKPIVGGITKFKPIHQHLIIRDALWAAANRLKNTATFTTLHGEAAGEDIYQVKQLMAQCYRVAPKAIQEGSLTKGQWGKIREVIDRVVEDIKPEEAVLTQVAESLLQAVDILNK